MSIAPTKSNDELKGKDFSAENPPAGYRKMILPYDEKKDPTKKQDEFADNLKPGDFIIIKFAPTQIEKWPFWKKPFVQFPEVGNPQFFCGYFKFQKYDYEVIPGNVYVAPEVKDQITVKDLTDEEYVLSLPNETTTGTLLGNLSEIYIQGSTPVAPATIPSVPNAQSIFSRGLSFFNTSSQPKTTGGKKSKKVKPSSNKKTKGKNRKTKKQGKKSKK